MSDLIFSDELDEILEQVYVMEHPVVQPHWFTSRDYVDKLKQKGITMEIGNASKRLNVMVSHGKLIRHDIGRFVYFELVKGDPDDEPNS